MAEVGDLYVTLRAVTEPFTRAMRDAAAQGERSTGTLGGAFNKLAKIGMVTGLAAAGIGAASVKMAADFQSSTTRLVTSAGETRRNLDLVRTGILNMAGQVGETTQNLSKAMYYVEAAGFHAGAGLTVLKAAAQGAAAEGADTTTVAQALTDVLKDYHLKASQAANVTSKMITAVAHGKVNLQDFSKAFASIVPAASGAGISFNDVGAALSSMTNHGFTAQRGAQNLAQALRSLLNPTKPMQKAFDEFGVSTAKLREKFHGPNGLTDAMEYLSQAATKAGKEGTPEFASALKRLMGTAAGANAALTTTGQNFGDTSATIKAMGGATADAKGRVEGFALVQKTFSQRLKETKDGLEAMAIKLGTVLLPYVTKFLGWIQKGVGWLTQHKGAVIALAGALGTTLVAAIAAIGTAMFAAFGWVEVIVVGVMAVGAAVVYCYNHFKTFRTVVNGVAGFLMGAFKLLWQGAAVLIRGFVATWDFMAKGVMAVAHWLNNNVFAWVKARFADLSAFWKQHGDQITAIAKAVFGFLGFAAQAWWHMVHPILIVFGSVWSTVWGVIRDTVKVVWSAISGIVTTGIHLVLNTVGLVLDLLSGKWSRVWGDLKHLVGQQLNDVVTTITNVGSGFATLLYNAGASVIDGLISGIKSALGGLGSTLGSIGDFITSHKGPPSYDKVMLHPAGQMIMQGLMDGLNSRLPHLAATAAGVGQTVQDSFAENLGIASPSKVFRNLGIYINEGLVDGLTGSTAKVKAATKRIETLLIQTYNKVADLKGTKGVSNKWVTSHEKTIKHLESYAAREDRILRGLAARRDSVAAKIKTAQKKLADLQKSWSDEVKSVSDGIMQGFSIVTEAPQEGFALTAQDVVNKMRDQMGKAVQFAAQLQALQKKGLSSDLIAQIAAAGVDQGGATATALASASKSQIDQINSLNKTTKSAANTAGKAVADSMYGAGIRSAQGLVKGLQSQEKAIEKQMMKIAESMKRAIKHALGIKSPSTVFAEIATWIPKGLAKGIDGGAHHATDAVNRLAGAVAGASAHSSAGLAMAGGGGTVVNNYTVNVRVEGSVRSDRDLREVVEQQMLRLGMRNPQSYTQYKR
ncbi:phage tail tape measure protein [Streptomyces sp. NPDC091215]|uniref:phage tail tape measure protein n=1 Tax=Streptomyces sp. NPDC091215 TaxID=3155192 RepID=UPI00343199CA